MFATWLALMATAAGLPADAGDAALSFLEKVRARTLNLEPGRDTALAEETSSGKRQAISRRLERMAGDLGNDPLEVAKVRVDGDYAAALVRKKGGFDPSRMRVLAIALIKRGGQWLAAPVPASFENTGSGHASGTRRRLDALEDWMLREQVLDLERLREESAQRLRGEISRRLPVETLSRMGPLEVAHRFVDACTQRNLPELLGLLGGLSVVPPEDWALRLKTAEAALAGEPVARAWHLLTSGQVLRATVHDEQDGSEALVSIGCLDPAGVSSRAQTPRVELVHLPLTKSKDGLWRVDPPESFHLGAEQEEDVGEGGGLDSELLDAFPGKLAELYPARPAPDVRAAFEALLRALRAAEPVEMVRLLAPAANAAQAREACIRAVQLWWLVRDPAALRWPLAPALREEGNEAAAICHIFSARTPERLDLRVFHFQKSPAGWLWSPVAPEITGKDLRQWVDAETSSLQESWRERILADCVEVEKVPETAAPDEAAARRLVEDWLASIAIGDVEAALRLTARLRKPDSPQAVLRNLGYEISGARKNTSAPVILGVQRNGGWAAVGVRGTVDGKPSFPLYPVIQTIDGPRILVEIDLIETRSRSRDFLNKTALSRLDGQPPAVAFDLRKLLQQHKQDTETRGAP